MLPLSLFSAAGRRAAVTAMLIIGALLARLATGLVVLGLVLVAIALRTRPPAPPTAQRCSRRKRSCASREAGRNFKSPHRLQAALEAGVSAQGATGDLAASRRSFERAYQLAEQAGQVQAMAQAAVGLAGLWVREHRTVTGAVRLEARLQHVLSLLDPRSSLGLRIRARLAGEGGLLPRRACGDPGRLVRGQGGRRCGAAGRGAEYRPPLPARS